MDLRTGVALMNQQFTALFKKNCILAWRHKRATFLQLFASFFFIFLLFCIGKAGSASRRDRSKNFEAETDPKTLMSPPIPPCEDRVHIQKPCFDLVWTGVGNPKIQKIVDAIMNNNPGRQIPAHKVKSFGSKDEAEIWLFKNPMSCPGGLHFGEKNGSISYGIQNSALSPQVTMGTKHEDNTLQFLVPFQLAAEREIARSLIGDPNFNWNVGLKHFAHPEGNLVPKTLGGHRDAKGEGDKDNEAADSDSEAIGPTFFLAIAMFGFIFQITNVVTEKELKLRQVMSIMGLYDTAYWFSWLTWEGIITFLSTLFLVIFGLIFQLDFFLNNNFILLFALFFLFQLNLTTYAFMLSSLISKAASATVVGFSIFIVGFLTQIVTKAGFPYKPDQPILYRIIWSLFPPNLLVRGVMMLTPTAHVTFSTVGNCSTMEPNCVMTLSEVYQWLIGTFFLWMILALYLDNIIPNPAGVRQSVYYFLHPGYWCGKGGNTAEEGNLCSCMGSLPPLDIVTPDDEDVLQEENHVKKQSEGGIVESDVAVQIRGLAKTYPGTSKCCCCCKCVTPAYHAVKGLWMNIEKDRLFCLLGPNGAGKTTTMGCLTGIVPVTGGDALVYGYSVRNTHGMSSIRKLIGVCPQFDILWDAMTGEEHLHLFSTIKGLDPDCIKEVVDKALEDMGLTKAAKMRAGSVSGGMKRRLSVAVAFIGDPRLVILDEPTTGMDPITRRYVWDIIENAKKGRAIILTTHSMEEADILSDRIAIMARGRLRCIGTSIRLKSKFGTGLIINVNFADSQTADHDAVKDFFKYRLGVNPKEESTTFMTFVITRDKEEALTGFFEELQSKERELGIADTQLGLTTLEEVFLNIANQAELEHAKEEGRTVTLTLSSGAQVEADASGELNISGHSPETPVPHGVHLTPPPAPPASSKKKGKKAQIIGIEIDPDQLKRH